MAADCFRLSENLFFDSLTAVKEAVKTSNSLPSAYIDTVGSELRSKSKRLAVQGVAVFHKKETGYHPDELQSIKIANHQNSALTVGDFFDTLK